MKLLLAILLAALFVLGVREHFRGDTVSAGRETMRLPDGVGYVVPAAEYWDLMKCKREHP